MDKSLIERYEVDFTYDNEIEYYSINHERNIKKYISNNGVGNGSSYKKMAQPFEVPLVITPVKMDKYMEFYTYINCFLLDKDKEADVKLISMSYLDYLIYLIERNDEKSSLYMYMFYGIVELCLGITIEDVKKGSFYWTRDKKNKSELVINNKKYTRKDFDIIKAIICEQNNVEVPDDKIDREFKEAMDSALAFKNKNSKKMGSLEDQMICVMISTSLSLDDIKSLTIRKFVKILQRIDYKLHYEIYKTAETSGMVTFKTGIDHWMSEIVIDKYKDLMVDFKETQDKIMGKQK